MAMNAEDAARLATRSDAMEGLARRAYAATVAVVHSARSDLPATVIGSGVLLRMGDARLLLTCAHVAEHDAFAARTHIHLHASRGSAPAIGAVQLNEPGMPTGRARDAVDVAVLRLASECVDPPGSEYLSLADVRTTVGANRELLCLGFPVKYASAGATLPTLDPDPLSYVTRTVGAGHRVRGPFLPSVNIAFEMEQKRARRRSGREETLPKFNGMSGGGVWAFDQDAGVRLRDHARLVGIFHSYYAGEGLGIATSVTAHLEVIERTWPDLRPILALHAQTLQRLDPRDR